MRTRYLLLALAIAIGSFTAFIVTLPVLAGGKPALEQDTDDEEPGYALNMYATADGQILMQPAEEPCPECGDDPDGGDGPIWPTPTWPITGPFDVVETNYVEVPGTNISAASSPGAVIFQGATGYDCVDEPPADFVTAGYVRWEGSLDCPDKNFVPVADPKYVVEAANSVEASSTMTTQVGYNRVAQLWDNRMALYQTTGKEDPDRPTPCYYTCCLVPSGNPCSEATEAYFEDLLKQVQLYTEEIIPD